MTTQTPRKNPFKKELEKLDSKKENDLLDAIKALRTDGNIQTTSKIIALLNRDVSDNVKNEVIRFLYDLKAQVALEPLFEAIQDENLRPYRAILISALWQSTVDGSSRMIELIELTSDSDYMEALEILTVLENFETSFNEDEVFEAIAIINEAKDSHENEEVLPLLDNMLEVLNRF